MSFIDLPTRSGWFVEIKTSNGNKVDRILSQKDCKTKLDVETFISHEYGITKEDCVKWEINECVY